MTVRFRIDTIFVDTDAGQFHYEFPGPLTVLAGKSGVGKSSLLQLIKHTLGGKGQLAKVVREHVTSATVHVVAGESRLALTRFVAPERAKTVRVVDLAGDAVMDKAVEGEDSVSDLLLTALGLPTGLRAPARTKASRSRGALVTFWDVLNFLYVPQGNINQDIAGSRDTYYEPKRRTVFEMLFNLTDADAVAAAEQLTLVAKEYDDARNEYDNVVTFLRDTRTTSQEQANAALAAAIAEQAAGEQRLAALRDEMRLAEDTETETVRLLLGNAEELLAMATRRVREMDEQAAGFTADLRGVRAELQRLARMRDAGSRIADIEFHTCPRCAQRLRNREVPHGHCRLCLQPEDPPASLDWDTTYEETQLRDQEAELLDAHETAEGDRERFAQEVAARRAAVAELSATLDERTRSRISPRLQAFDDANRAVASARARQEWLETVLRQWDRADDLERERDALATEVAHLREVVRSANARLRPRREEVITELSTEFESTMTALLGDRRYSTLTINPDSYLPYLDGRVYRQAELAGGILTITQVAYWLSLLAVALRRRDTSYPAFLMLDSPRTSLNEEIETAAAMYARFTTLADANRDRLQFLIADNELPAHLRRDFAEIDFDFANPTIRTVSHPGPGQVELLEGAEDG